MGGRRRGLAQAAHRGDPRARVAGRSRARPRRLGGRQPLHPRASAVARRLPVAARSDPGQGDGQGRHQGLPRLAPPRRAQGPRGRLRHRLCLCRRRPRAAAVLPVAAAQPAQRRVWRLAREPDAAAARGDRGHQGGDRRHLRGGGAPHHRRAVWPGRHRGRQRRPRHRRHAGRAARRLGRQGERLGRGQPDQPLRQGGLPGALCLLRQAGDHQAGHRRRPLHLARRDGVAGEARHPRPDRLGAAVDRRSVPAAQDRGGADRGHPRVHRLQHLRGELQCRGADQLHPEPDHRRGVQARLASRALPAGGVRGHRPDRRRRTVRPRMRPGARQPRLPGAPGRGGPRARRPGGAGSAARRPERMGPGARLAHHPARQDGQRLHLSGKPDDRRRRDRLRRRPGGDRDRRQVAPRRLRPQQPQADRDGGRGARVHPRRRHG